MSQAQFCRELPGSFQDAALEKGPAPNAQMINNLLGQIFLQGPHSQGTTEPTASPLLNGSAKLTGYKAIQAILRLEGATRDAKIRT